MNKFERAARKGRGVYITVTYYLTKKFEGYIDVDYELEKLAKKYKGSEFGSGCGFGGRDISYGFLENKQGKQFIAFATKLAKKLKIKVKFDKPVPLSDYFGVEERP